MVKFHVKFNILSFSLKDKHTIFNGIQKRLCINKFLEKHQYTTCEKVPVELKKLISDHLKKKFEHRKENSNVANDIRTLCSCRRAAVLEKYSHLGLDWSLQVEFDQSILIWHIATDLCYYSDWRDQDAIMSNGKLSKWQSQCTLCLLVMCPFMLPMGLGMIKFRDTCAEVTQFFEEHKSIASYSDMSTLDISQACEILLNVNTQVPPTKVKGDRSKSVLFDACKLASELQAIYV